MTDEPDPEVAALKQRVDELTEALHDVRAEQQRRNQELVETLRTFGLSGKQIEGAVKRGMEHGLTRRAALLGIVASVGGAGYIAGTENARAAPTGQMGTAAEPIDIIYADEIGQSGNEVTTVFTETVEVGTINGQNVVKSSTKEYDVQKDGSDASGNINFKTS